MKFNINEENKDEFGRVNGIFAVDKPKNVRAHDLVYDFRRKYNTREVGHAGALDPFATGLMILLVGKATKMSDEFLNLDKEYEATILFGISTDSADTEGTINGLTSPIDFSEKDLMKVFELFKENYDQYVPIFSSVKVKGEKLRELARKADSFNFLNQDGKVIVDFIKNDNSFRRLELPHKIVKITLLELLEFKTIDFEELNQNYPELYSKIKNYSADFNSQLKVAKIRVACSKGTYIRQLAEDIGKKLDEASMLIELRRTRVGDIVI